MIVYAMCGSFCTLKESFGVLDIMSQKGYDILPVMSERVSSTDTRFGKADNHLEQMEQICKKKVVRTVREAEPIGPTLKPDAMIICPCTGNTLAKIANGITDSSVTMAAKAHLRNEKPLIIALASNDALSANFVNLARLASRKNIYFVPMEQDDPIKKPNSLIARFDLVQKTLEKAMLGKQFMPMFLTKKENTSKAD